MKFELFEESYFIDIDALSLAKELIGHHLVTNIDGVLTSGIIVETEAYLGIEDKASHAFDNRYTQRTAPMFGPGGRAYVYLCYGIHRLFNVVCGPEGTPEAVLIRAIEPNFGADQMKSRRNLKQKKLKSSWTSGPGLLTEALGIGLKHNGMRLFERASEVFIAYNDKIQSDQELTISPRVGIPYAGEWIDKPLRFRMKDSKWTSKAK